MSLEIITFGCRLNAYESEIIRARASKAGLDQSVIVNTCAVTAEAERQARQSIRRLRRQYPHRQLIVTGCSAQIDPDRYAAMPEVDQVIGNREKLNPELLSSARVQVSERFAAGSSAVSRSHSSSQSVQGAHAQVRDEPDQPILTRFAGRARAFVQVQQGCDHHCTFCIIPQGRGPSRSLTVERIIRQIRALVGAGYQEVVLTGVDLWAYGRALEPTVTLGSMVSRVLTEIPELPRLRISSLDPLAVDRELIRLLAEQPRLMPHLHLSLQSGDDLILRRMKRRHRRNQVLSLCQQLRSLRPEIVFGADLIAGFPTEGEEHFQNSQQLVEECDLTWLHVFPYSPRPGTPAARMPQLSAETIKSRAARMRAGAIRQAQRFLTSQIGRQVRVLLEDTASGNGGLSGTSAVARGRTEHYAKAHLPQAPESTGIVSARVISVQDGHLVGRVEIA